MTERPASFDGERRQTDDLAPENENSEQVDVYDQAQTVADQALNRSTSVLGLEDSEKVASGLFADDTQDIVDHMKQMDRSGQVDMSAYAGEPDHDDSADPQLRRPDDTIPEPDELPADSSGRPSEF